MPFPDGKFLLKICFDKHSWWTREQKNCTPGLKSKGDNRASEVKWTAAIRSVFTLTGSCEWHRFSVCPWVPPTPTEPLRGKIQMESVLYRFVIHCLLSLERWDGSWCVVLAVWNVLVNLLWCKSNCYSGAWCIKLCIDFILEVCIHTKYFFCVHRFLDLLHNIMYGAWFIL